MKLYNLEYYIGEKRIEISLSKSDYKKCVIKRTVLQKAGAHKMGTFKINRAS